MNEKLTAYALNEMSPEEKAAFEAELQTDATLRAQAEEMKSFCNLLNDHVPKHAADEFSQEQRAEVLNSLEKESKVIRPSFFRTPFWISSAAVAACVAILLVKHWDRAELSQNHGSIAGTNDPLLMDIESSMRSKKKEVTPIPSTELKTEVRREQVAAGSRVTAGRELLASEAKPYSFQESAGATDPLGQIPMPTAAPRGNKPLAKTSANDDILGGPVHDGLAQTDPQSPVIAMQAGPMESPSFADLVDNLPSTGDLDLTRESHTLPYIAPNNPLVSIPAEPEPSVSVGRKSELAQPTKPNQEKYQSITENSFLQPTQQPLSTFSVHTDGASYANVRRFLNDGQRPPAEAVRIEELINYFPYDYEQPKDEHPFSVDVAMTEAPWSPQHRLARIAIKGREIHKDRGPANLVFLVDVSGSMNQPNKLPLVQQSLRLLTEQLKDTDRVALVTYAGNSRLVLESTPASERSKILSAIEGLNAGGSTNGASGIHMAYDQAATHFNNEGINRVVLCSDGDFNVGVSSPDELERLISEKAKSKVFLSVLGFGKGNLNDHIMETLATKGNGNHAYIDSLGEARKVLVEQADGTLVTIAKDVKIQIEFNPAQVASYRLIGYENRTLAKEDFNNDAKDAGEIGAGHTVTALYEIVPVNIKYPNGHPLVDALKYATAPASAAAPDEAAASAETMTVKLRYKLPNEDKSQLLEVPVTDSKATMAKASQDMQFAASVAGFGMLLRGSSYAGELSWDQVRELALKGKGSDPQGYRGEFIQLIEKARGVTGSK